jgi:hypothetical protein
MLCGDERCDGCDEKASLKLRAKDLAGTSEAELLKKIWREAQDQWVPIISSTSPIHLPHRITHLSPCDMTIGQRSSNNEFLFPMEQETSSIIDDDHRSFS